MRHIGLYDKTTPAVTLHSGVRSGCKRRRQVQPRAFAASHPGRIRRLLTDVQPTAQADGRVRRGSKPGSTRVARRGRRPARAVACGPSAARGPAARGPAARRAIATAATRPRTGARPIWRCCGAGCPGAAAHLAAAADGPHRPQPVRSGGFRHRVCRSRLHRLTARHAPLHPFAQNEGSRDRSIRLDDATMIAPPIGFNASIVRAEAAFRDDLNDIEQMTLQHRVVIRLVTRVRHG